MAAGRGLLGTALAALIVFLALTAVVTQEGFDRLDGFARSLVHRPGYPFLDASMETASFLGGHPGQIVVIALASTVLWRQRRRRWGAALPMVMAGAGVLQLLAKWAIDRPRPNLDPWGFPSAHVLTVVVLAGYIAYVVGTSKTRAEWRTLGLGICATVVCTVAVSRMYLDAHWLSDVLGGFSIGVAYLLTAIWLIGQAPLAQKRTATPTAANGPASTSIRF
jgi:undecaprenyl-diphosphatase